MQVDMGVVHRHNPRIILGINEVPEIRYDYSFFQKNRGKLNNYLIPLEIIFRNGLPEGSSIFKRIEKAKKETDSNKMEKALKEIYDSLGIKSEPKPGDMLPEPVMNYTTKLEPGDRNLTETDAYRISGLNSNDFKEVGDVAFEVNNFVTKQAQKTGFVHYDGKVEMVWNNGPIVADVVGTFDEDRFGFKGEQVSKEFLRQWYKKNQPEFSKACDEWKEKGEDWQQRCPVKPRKLYPKLSKLVSQMYMAGCNKYVERNIFDVPDLEEVMEEIRPFR
jgi:phosphoribosylaminoimidazole-succinocarboxamide synthase